MEVEFKSADGRPEIVRSKSYKVMFIAFLILLLNSGYLAASSNASLFYLINLLLHIVLGLALVVPLVTKVRYFIKTDMLHGKTFGETAGRMGYFVMKLAFISGIYLMIAGNLKGDRLLLYFHVLAGFFASMCLISSIRRAAYNISVENTYWRAGRWGLTVFVIAGTVPLTSILIESAMRDDSDLIRNVGILPSSLEEAAYQGDDGPFYPSPAETKSGKRLETAFLHESAACGRQGCHVDVLQQFTTSRHYRSALDIPGYQKSWAYTQAIAGSTATRYCAGCHAPAALFAGEADFPAEKIVESANHNAGVQCTACHAIAAVKNSLGEGAYVVEKPSLTWLSLSEVPLFKKLEAFFIYLDPDPHRSMYLKPFLKNESNEFCSSCHKMTLEKPYTSTSPVPGLLEYDMWAGSVFNNSDIKSFAEIAQQYDCISCHMPLVPSDDPGGDTGLIRDHSFAVATRHAGNTLPVKSAASDSLLSAGLSLRLFVAAARKNPISLDTAASPAFKLTDPAADGSRPDAPVVRPGANGAKVELLLPEEGFRYTVQPGQALRIEVLVRSQGLPHAFPAGAPGASCAWLTLTLEPMATDSANRSVQRPLGSPYFYGSRFIDVNGNAIAIGHGAGAAGILYHRYIPPEGADLVPFEFRLPEGGPAEANLVARLYIGKAGRESIEGVAWQSDRSHDHVQLAAAQLERAGITNKYPVAEQRVKLVIGKPAIASPPMTSPAERATFWNEYGMGLLWRSRYIEAREVLKQASRLAPENLDIQINLVRAHLLLGETDAALAALQRLHAEDWQKPKAQYFVALCLKAKGQYDQAKEILRNLRRSFPRDRGIMNELGHVYYLLQSYKAAHTIFRRLTHFAPDDPVAHFFLSHTYRKQNKLEKAAFEEKLYQRFSRRLNGYVVRPSLSVEQKFAPWQVMPWSNYEHFTPPAQGESQFNASLDRR